MPKNFTKVPCGGGHIGVHEDAHRSAGTHGGKQAAPEVIFVEYAVAMQAADGVHISVERAIVEAANHHPHGMAHEGVIEAGKLPSAEMAGDDQHSLAARLGGEKMLQALSPQPCTGVLRCVAAHAAKFDEVPTQMQEDATQNFLSGAQREFGQRHGEVAQPDAPQPPKDPIDLKGENAGPQPRQPARHEAKAARHGYHKAILKLLPHG